MGPRHASEIFLKKNSNAQSFEVTLYGSLAATGRGHLTDKAILDVLQAEERKVEIIWKNNVFLPFHPNGMKFRALNSDGDEKDSWTIYSVGGGALAEEGDSQNEMADVYEYDSMDKILEWCRKNGRTYWEYVEKAEGKEIWNYLAEVWKTMRESVERGIEAEGVLPGPLHLQRKATAFHIKASGYTGSLHGRGLVFSYALAVSEENAGGGKIVTAPTCGSWVLFLELYIISGKAETLVKFAFCVH
jgi:L-serine dehydratase